MYLESWIKTYLNLTLVVKSQKLYRQHSYSPYQQKLFDLCIKFKKEGMGYRKISHYLNEKNILTERGNRWGSNYVYSVLKRYKERQDRIRLIIKKKDEREISNLWLEYN